MGVLSLFTLFVGRGIGLSHVPREDRIAKEIVVSYTDENYSDISFGWVECMMGQTIVVRFLNKNGFLVVSGNITHKAIVGKIPVEEGTTVDNTTVSNDWYTMPSGNGSANYMYTLGDQAGIVELITDWPLKVNLIAGYLGEKADGPDVCTQISVVAAGRNRIQSINESDRRCWLLMTEWTHLVCAGDLDRSSSTQMTIHTEHSSTYKDTISIGSVQSIPVLAMLESEKTTDKLNIFLDTAKNELGKTETFVASTTAFGLLTTSGFVSVIPINEEPQYPYQATLENHETGSAIAGIVCYVVVYVLITLAMVDMVGWNFKEYVCDEPPRVQNNTVPEGGNDGQISDPDAEEKRIMAQQTIGEHTSVESAPIYAPMSYSLEMPLNPELSDRHLVIHPIDEQAHQTIRTETDACNISDNLDDIHGSDYA